MILRDPVAKANFLSDGGDLESALLRLGPAVAPKTDGLTDELEVAVEAMKNVPWTTLQALKGDREILAKLEDAENLLKSLRAALS